MKRKGDTADAQRYAAGSPVLPATRGQVSRELFPSYNGLPSARKPRSRLVLPWLPRLPPGKKGTAVRVIHNASSPTVTHYAKVSKTPCITGMFFGAKALNQVPPFSSQGDM
ncbi:hypothetical protein H671_6g16413 [Cricetulus griseus]|nr:hypothetical protein H671_6g16413 [Cricetulus griseus]